jgi:hypothetical protein
MNALAVMLLALATPTAPSCLSRVPIDADTREWYCGCLQGLGEHELQQRVDTLRFTYLPSFQQARTIRVEKRQKDVLVVSSTFNKRRSCGVADGVTRHESIVGMAEWEKLMHLADNAGFWTDPDRGGRGQNDLDGDDWLLEGVLGGRYQGTAVWQPRRRAPQFTRLCERIAELGGVPIERPAGAE